MIEEPKTSRKAYQNLISNTRINASKNFVSMLLNIKHIDEIITDFLGEEEKFTENITPYKLFCVFRSLRNIHKDFWHTRDLLSRESHGTQHFIELVSLVLLEALKHQMQSKVSILEAIQLVLYNLKHEFDTR